MNVLDFWRDLGLAYKAVIAGRKVGGDRGFWTRLTNDEGFFRQMVRLHKGAVDNSSGLPDIDWVRVYAELGMSVAYALEIGTLDMSERPGQWAVPVLQGVTPNKIVAALRKLDVTVYTYVDDLDTAVPTNDRDPKNGSYIVHFKKTIEADPELANLSANDLRDHKIDSDTLIERLLLELGYFLSTGKHLDEKNITLCAGSRRSGGRVPDVHWDPGDRRVWVYWFPPAYSNASLRARAAGSLAT